MLKGGRARLSAHATLAVSRGGKPNFGLPEAAMHTEYASTPQLGRSIPVPMCIGDDQKLPRNVSMST